MLGEASWPDAVIAWAIVAAVIGVTWAIAWFLKNTD